MFRSYALVLLLTLSWTVLSANDIQILNLSVDPVPGQASRATLTFDLSWQHAWRTAVGPANWDAAWVFAKYRTGPGQPWQHVILHDEARPTTGATIEVYDHRGAMVYSTLPLAGPARFTGTGLVWDLAANGLTSIAGVEVRVYGLEMVYIPKGAFYLGSATGGTETDRFYGGGSPGQTPPYRVADSGAIRIGTEAGMLTYTDDGQRGSDIQGPVPAAFPSGYDAFYLMKYEVSQQQYVDFVNTLTYEQKLLYDITNREGKNTDRYDRRNCVSWNDAADGDAFTTAPHIPIGYVSTRDMFGYFDWAALRPMSEMEFEKACRGPEAPVAEEYAWGTPKIVDKSLAPANLNAADEQIVLAEVPDPETGYAAYKRSTTQTSYGKGPYRCGIFSAAQALPSRTGSGAGYYGNMELSGNQWEGVVTITHADGLAFTNTHGDGALGPDGTADVATWPTTTDGIGIRGGRSDNDAVYLRVADRSYVTVTGSTRKSRYYWLQYRGARGLSSK